MRVVIFGLTISSSWGNGHATLWRSLVRAMLRRGHTVTFFEKDVPYYASTRDLTEPGAGGELVLYESFEDVRGRALRAMDDADLALCTSYCADGAEISRRLPDSHAAMTCFYDMDTPVTLEAVEAGRVPAYLASTDLSGFDVVLSFTGGLALEAIRRRMRAQRVVAFYGSVDPEVYQPFLRNEGTMVARTRAALSYLGTYAQDRQAMVEELFLRPAALQSDASFVLGGAQYPATVLWPQNVSVREHVAPAEHAEFYSSARATLNVTRSVMSRYGYCPSGRLFEAACCGTAILSDMWEGLETFFVPGRELLPVLSYADVLHALELSDAELQAIGQAARARVLAEHTGDARVEQLEAVCSAAPLRR